MENYKSNMETESEGIGNVEVTDEVVCIIAGLAAAETNGVVGMSGGLVGGIAGLLGKKNLSKGVKVKSEGKQVSVELYVIMEYGVCIPDVSIKIQEKVKEAIETMGGMEVVEIDVHVQGIKHIEKVKEEEIKELVD